MNRIIFPLLTLLAAAMPVIADSAVKTSALLLLVAVAVLCMRKASAAARHLAWMIGVLGLLFLPVLSAILPGWRVLPGWAAVSIPVERIEPSAPQPLSGGGDVEFTRADSAAHISPVHISPFTATSPSGAFTPDASPATAPRDAAFWFFVTWLPIAALLLLRVLLSMLFLRIASRGAVAMEAGPLHDALQNARRELGVRQRVQLLLDERRIVPLVWGIFRPRLVLPAESGAWAPSRLRAVLLHELAHVQRRDLLVMLLTQVACALHWFNPLVWIAAWRLHIERERACDDLVLAAGVKASDYAEHLLHVATKLETASPAGALAMARPSRLEGRLLAVLNAQAPRGRVPRSLALAALAIAFAVLIPIAMLRAEEKPGPPPARLGTGPIEVTSHSHTSTTPAADDVLAAPTDGKVQHTNRAGRWRLGGGVILELTQRVYHGADVVSHGILWWPAEEGRPALRHEFSLAADAFANREPWKMVWEPNGTTLYIAVGKSRFMGEDRGKKHVVARVRQLEFSKPAAIVETHWSSAGPVVGFVRAALADDFEILAEDGGREVQSYTASARLEHTWVVTGTTRDTSGQPLPNVPIALYLDDEKHPFEQTRSDPKGQFWTSIRPPLTALTQGCAIKVQGNRINGAAAPPTFAPATIQLQPEELARHARGKGAAPASAADFVGIVETPDGKPFSYALIAALKTGKTETGFTTRADENGKFRLAGVPVGTDVHLLVEDTQWKRRGSIGGIQFAAGKVRAAKLTLAHGKGWEWNLILNESTPEEIEKAPAGANAFPLRAAGETEADDHSAAAQTPQPATPTAQTSAEILRLLNEEIRLAEEKLKVLKSQHEIGATNAVPAMEMEIELLVLRRTKARREQKQTEVARLFDEQIRLLEELQRTAENAAGQGSNPNQSLDIQRQILAVKREKLETLAGDSTRQ